MFKMRTSARKQKKEIFFVPRLFNDKKKLRQMALLPPSNCPQGSNVLSLYPNAKALGKCHS
jgi:hypothetical protein